MDIVRFKSGLGNQMFQYAFLRALQERGRTVKASLGFYNRHPDERPFVLCDVFYKIKLDYISDEEFDQIDRRWKEIKRKGAVASHNTNLAQRFFWVEENSCAYYPDVFMTRNCTFVGYWQTEKYFSQHKKKLLQELEFDERNPDLVAVANEIRHGSYVSVHVRRGDYIAQQHFFANVGETQYYEHSIDYIMKAAKNIQWAIFSDDMVWTKDNFCLPDALYVEAGLFRNYRDWYDMYLMSLCRHNIIANSTFSWWGAWLNRHEDKIVIAPKRWFQTVPTPDICPDSWLRLE